MNRGATRSARTFIMSSKTIVIIVATSACGCSSRSVISQPIESSATSDVAEPGGLVYSLPKTILTVSGDKGSAGLVTYKVLTTIVPDEGARFRLRFVGSAWTDNDLDFKVDSNGLLSSGKANVTDQSGEVLVQLARSAGAIAAVAGGGVVPFSAVTAPKAQPSEPSPYPFTQILELNQVVGHEVILPDKAIFSIKQKSLPDIAGLGGVRDCGLSVCYRTMLSMTASVRGSASDQESDVQINVVNPNRVEGFDLRGAALVARTNAVTFENGVLTGAAVNKPSTLVAVAKVPYNILSGFFSAFGELLTIRVNNTKDEAGLIDAQTQLLKNLQAQIEAQQALAKAQKTASP